jgi:hypothetical protein
MWLVERPAGSVLWTDFLISVAPPRSFVFQCARLSVIAPQVRARNSVVWVVWCDIASATSKNGSAVHFALQHQTNRKLILSELATQCYGG